MQPAHNFQQQLMANSRLGHKLACTPDLLSSVFVKLRLLRYYTFNKISGVMLAWFETLMTVDDAVLDLLIFFQIFFFPPSGA